MEVFLHHIYEYQKGLRNLVFCTLHDHLELIVSRKLEKLRIDYLIWHLPNGRMNVFFGHLGCIEVLRSFNKASLNCFTAEEDFILGIMLGYDRLKQCRRFLDSKEKKIASFRSQSLPEVNNIREMTL